MRDIFVTCVIFGSLPFILRQPFVGVLMWTWIALMNPHRLTWGFAYEMQFALIVAITTLVSLLLSKEPKKIPKTPETLLLGFFVFWMLLSTIFSFYPELAWLQMEKVAKIQLMVFVTIMLTTSKERIHWLVWVITFSLGFYGVKGGIFTITTGGAYHVRGPDGSFIGGDNEIGLALIMTIPLLRYIQLTAPYTWLRTGMSLAILLTAVAVVGSQSRGALVGLVAMGVFLWLKTRNKVFTSLLGIVAVFMVVNIMPQSWFDRISSIKTYEQDASATGRINSWHMAFNLAKDHPLVGGGFETFRKPTFAMYAPNPGDVHDSHSIYFEVLGEHGFVGFAIFLLLGWATWRSASWVIRTAKKDPERRWMADLAAMIQVSLVGYASAGAFLGLAYFDLYYTLIAVVVVLKVLLKTEIAANPRAVPASRRAPAVLGAQPVSQRNAVL